MISYSMCKEKIDWEFQKVSPNKCRVIATKVPIAQYIPKLPISSAKTANFYYNGVSSDGTSNIIFSFPHWVFFPTAKTIIVPVPSIIFEPEIKKQFKFSSSKVFGGILRIGSLSPVTEDSSAAYK